MPWDEQIESRLDELRRRLLWLSITGGVWRSMAGVAALALAASLLELVFHFEPGVRFPLLMGALLLSLLIISALVMLPIIRHLLRPKPREKLALLWGYSISGMNDRLLNALQVYERRNQERTSSELAELALKTVATEIQGSSYEGALDHDPVRKARRQLLWACGIWMVALVVFQGSLGSAAGRMLQPRRDFRPPPPFSLKLMDLPRMVIRGEPLDISILGTGSAPDGINVTVLENEADPKEFYVEFDSTSLAKFTFSNPQNDLKICASWGNVCSDTARVTVKTRPFLKELQVRWYPPAYSKLPPGASSGKRGDVSALKGSRVRISIDADRKLQDARLVIFDDHNPEEPRPQEMAVEQSEATAEFTLMKSGHYNVIIEDLDGIKNAQPVDYSLWPIQDEWPTITIIYPPPEAELNESLCIPIKGGARDDFAISKLALGSRLVKQGQEDSTAKKDFTWEQIPFEDIGDGTVLADYLWDLNDLNLLPGDVIDYKLAAWDNDQISGPKRAESPAQRLRFPTMEEIFSRVEQSYGDQVEDVTETLNQSKALKEELEALHEELKRNPDLSWEEKKNVEDMLKRQQEMARQAEEMSKAMDKMIRKMQDNQMFSPETMEKYSELQKMLAQVMTPELMKAMQQLQEALKRQDPEALRRAVEEFSLNQEEFLDKMEKTINILKQLQMEMKLDELAKRAEALLEKQKEINEALNDSSMMESLQEERQAEKDLQKEMESFENEFQKAQEMLKESPFNPEEAMSKAEQLLDENQFPKSMNAMSQELQQGEMNSAKRKGGSIQNGLAQLSDAMKKAKEQMINASKSKLADELKKISYDLLQLSYSQEDLSNTSGDLDKASPRFRSLAQEQQTLKNHLEKTADDLFKLSQQSYFITPQIGAAINRAFQGMDQALSGYTARAPRSVAGQQQVAMGGLNSAIMELDQSLDQLSSSSSSTGFSEMMEQLSQMAGQQGQINQGTMSLLPGGTNPGQFSLEQQAAMGRLAAEQEALRQQMEQWSQANQEVSKMMGRLGELGKEMKEVVDDLKNRQVDERTLQRQERILRRLLDAQKSVREREYRRERLSKTAEGIYAKESPDEVKLSMAPDEAKENLLRALKEGYTRDYQQLIRNYFEALAREN